MAGKAFWRCDWLLGLSVAIAVFLLSGTDLVGSLERKAYGQGARVHPRAPWRVAVIQHTLARDQAQRYKNGEEMARAVRECAEAFATVDVSL